MKPRTILFAAMAACVGGIPLSANADLDVVAVYYPHWHQYPKGTEWFGERWNEGEWAFVKDAPARYPGHHQPMKPLPGYLSGRDPKDVETEIALAANAGIDVFLYGRLRDSRTEVGGRISSEGRRNT